jgi:hypothetical protein
MEFFFLWGNLKEHICGIHSRTIEDLVARLQAAVTVVSENMLSHIQENVAIRCIVSALKWMEDALNNCCNYKGPQFDHFDTLHLLMSQDICYAIFSTFLLTRNHPMESISTICDKLVSGNMIKF